MIFPVQFLKSLYDCRKVILCSHGKNIKQISIYLFYPLIFRKNKSPYPVVSRQFFSCMYSIFTQSICNFVFYNACYKILFHLSLASVTVYSFSLYLFLYNLAFKNFCYICHSLAKMLLNCQKVTSLVLCKILKLLFFSLTTFTCDM